MISFLTTRDKAEFPSYLTSFTSSESSSANDVSRSNYYTSFASISDGKSLSVTLQNGNGSATHSDSVEGGYSASDSQEGGTTSYGDATMGSVSQSSASTAFFNGTDSDGATTSTFSNTTSDESSTSYSALLSDTLFTQHSTAYTYPRTTTANVPVTTTHYLISGIGTNGTLTTATEAVTAVGTTTDEGAATSSFNITTALVFATYYDIGGLYSADTDWFWQIENTNFSPQLVSDIGASAAALTVWPMAVTQAQNIVTVDYSGALTSIQIISADTSALSYQVLFSTTTDSSTIPSGDSISFDTASTSVSIWTTDTASMVVGVYESSIITAVSTESYTATTWRMDTFNATVTYPYGLNTSTTELVQLTSYFDTTTLYSIPPAYLISSSSLTTGGGGGEGYSEMGQTIHGADLFFQNFNVIPWGGTAQAICPIAPFAAFVAPSDLRSAGNPYNFADNLVFGDTRIPYPNFAAVFSQAQTPSPFAFTTTGTDAHSFSYSWSRNILKYTEWSTYEAGGSTLTNKTKSSGIFNPNSPMSAYYADGGTVYGGFPAIPTAADSVYFQPRAVIGTSIDTDGASTTYRTLEAVAYSQAISETAVIEQTIPAFIVLAQLGEEPGGQSFFVYQRN